jgi:hypothetical protein
MPSASTSTLRMPSASISSLSHSMTVRSSIAAFSIGTSSSSRSLGDDEAADMLREVARKADDLLARSRSAQARSVGVEADLARRVLGPRATSQPQICEDSAAIASSDRPMALPTSRIGALAAVVDDGGAQPGAVAAVFS